jgi:hypothetical protein
MHCPNVRLCARGLASRHRGHQESHAAGESWRSSWHQYGLRASGSSLGRLHPRPDDLRARPYRRGQELQDDSLGIGRKDAGCHGRLLHSRAVTSRSQVPAPHARQCSQGHPSGAAGLNAPSATVPCCSSAISTSSSMSGFVSTSRRVAWAHPSADRLSRGRR